MLTPIVQVLYSSRHSSPHRASTLLFLYDLLVIDLYLPGALSGLEVITSIHQHIPPVTLAIILTSATSQIEVPDLQAHLPTVTVLRKPFHLKDLLALIEKRAISPTPCSV